MHVVSVMRFVLTELEATRDEKSVASIKQTRSIIAHDNRGLRSQLGSPRLQHKFRSCDSFSIHSLAEPLFVCLERRDVISQ
jgi:hypothetical protein